MPQRIIFGVVVVMHGVIHLGWLSPLRSGPNDTIEFRSPLFPRANERALQWAAILLVAGTVGAFTLAALGLWGVPYLASRWGAWAITGSVLSLIVSALLWRPWYVAGPFVDAAIIAVVLSDLI